MPEKASETFNPKFEQEVEHALDGIGRGARIVCLADGARSNWTYFESHQRLKNSVHINDFWHGAQTLSQIASALFGEGTAEAERWFKKYRHVLKTEDGGVEQVVRSIRYYRRKLRTRSASMLKEIREGLRYFTRNRKRMKYAEYRRQGLPIGSASWRPPAKRLLDSA